MKSSFAIKTPSPWPINKLAVLDMCRDWYNPNLVEVNTQVIEKMPVGEVVAPAIGQTNLEQLGAQTPLADAAAFAVAMNAINYMFWDVNEQNEFERYQHKGQIGALAMTEAFKQAWEDPHSALSRARQGVALTANDITQMFGPIPEVESRVHILNEVLVGPTLPQLAQEIAQSESFNTTTAHLLAEAFPQAYGDNLLKKAQLAVSGIWREARLRGYEGECDLTAFADYQIPNVLRALGVLSYNQDLADRIDNGHLIVENSPEEKAIRAAAVLAVEEIARVQRVSVADVDFWVWLKRKEPKTPFHLTRTTAY